MMTRIAIILLMLLSVGLIMAVDPVPWPMQPQDGTHNLYHSYGDYHRPWSEVTGSNSGINFHSGIDLTDPTPDRINDEAEDVYCVRSGFITWRDWMDEDPDSLSGADHDDYAIVICDIEGQTTGYGWSYQHIENRLYLPTRGNPFEVNMHYDLEARIGDIDNDVSSQGGPGWTGDHLHFMRSAALYDHNEPGYCNPLFYLNLEPVQSAEFTWEWLCTPSQEYRFFAIPQYDALTQWGSHWVDLNACKTEIDDCNESISGAVDLVVWFVVNGTGSTGSMSPRGVMPQQLEWWLERWDPVTSIWYEVQDISGTPYRRYPFDFGDIELGGLSDWERYKQLYFRFDAMDFFSSSGTMCCLTNCTYDEDWNGIENITESYWQTDVQKDLSGPTNNPVLQLTPDGPSYRVAIQPYVFDGVGNTPLALSPAYAELELHNSSPIVMSAEIINESMAVVYDAYWDAVETLQGLEAELVINVNESVQLDQTLTATVVFSEPVNTSTINITAGKPPDFNDLTVTTTSWSCTNNPEPYYDTWHGTIEVPEEGISGTIKLCIDGEDLDGNCLKDPAGAFMDEVDDYSDTHHGFGIAFGIQPGWPITLSDKVYGSPVLGDIDGDGDLDISVLCADGLLYILDDDGSVMYDEFWPVDDGEWQEYLSTLTSSPALADIDGNGSLDIVGVHVEGCLAIDAASGEELDGWPCYPGISTIPAKFPGKSSPTVADVDGDGDLEVILTRHLTVPEITTLETSVFLIDHTGDCLWARNLNPPDGASVISTPAVGDVSSSHPGNEIVVCTAEGYQAGKDLDLFNDKFLNSAVYLLDPADGSDIVPPAYYSCYFWASPVVADIDDDGENEIIIGTGISGTSSRRVLVLDGNTLNEEHVWNVGSMVKHPVAVGDLNDDGILDVVAVDNSGAVNCWSGDDFSGGSQYDPLPGFPVTAVGVPAAPSIADIDGDFELEIIVGTGDGYLYAINYDGTICSGYPVACGNGIYGQVAIGNIDDDNSLEMIFADDTDPVLYCYDLGAGTFPALMPWRQFQHDSWHTGCFEADNTVPEPPTNLSGEITYSGGCEVDLEWDLSVNDPYSGSPEEPTDVIVYKVMRRFSSFLAYRPIAKVHAGNDSYTDIFSPGGLMNSQVYYAVVACDGTNVSVYSNIIQFPTSPSDVISLGCSVVEEFSTARVLPGTLQISEMQASETQASETQASEMQASETQITEELSNAERTSVLEGTAETLSTLTESAVLSGGNPGCLTDGNTEVCYAPSPGADAVVIDLGEECTVTSVVPERMSGTSPDVSARRVETVRTLETAHAVEPSLLIEVAGSDREFYPFFDEARNSTETVRYIRIRGASGLSEISVYGSRGTDNEVLSVEITRSTADESWMFAIPAVEHSEEALVNIYDISGRMIWSGHSESGSVLHWDGYTGDGTPVPNGVYLLQCSIGSEISTGSFVVRRE